MEILGFGWGGGGGEKIKEARVEFEGEKISSVSEFLK